MESLVSGYIIGKFVEAGERSFLRNVVQPWRERRAKRFFESFCHAVSKESPVETQEYLDGIFKDEVRSGILFDAYRAVCLSRSRNLGPRIIALLVARIVMRDGVPTEDEEMIFAAAEDMTDGEFTSCLSYYRETESLAEQGSKSGCRADAHGLLYRDLRVSEIDSNWPSQPAPVAPQSLGVYVGTWASKLSRSGLVDDEVEEVRIRYQADSEWYVDQDGETTKYTWRLVFLPAVQSLCYLISQASMDEDDADCTLTS